MQNDARRLAMAPESHTPGTDGIWTFVFIDMSIFLLIFFTFMSERLRNIELYAVSQQQLNEWFGLANTLIFLTSSWMVVNATRSAKQRVPAQVSRNLMLAFLLGVAFAVDKLIEYRLEFEAGITPATNPFFSFYFFITIVHFLHVLAGLVFLGFSWKRANAHDWTPRHVSSLENVGLFWHYVDVLWIFIFPSLYLLGRRS
jgi:nitric oxide reductase NorE protein